MSKVDVLIVGQGLAGSCLAWSLHWSGYRVLIIDQGEPITASKIAAGLITPITGRRLSHFRRYAETYKSSVEFYRRIEIEAGCRLLEEKPSIRQFINDNERILFEEKYGGCNGDFIPINDDSGRATGFEMREAARLDVSRFLEFTRQHFMLLGQYQQAELDPDADVVVDESGASVARLDIRSATVVFCQGYQGRSNRWFPAIPDSPAKGEILRVRLAGLREDCIIHKGVWLVPDTFGDREADYLVGATYDRQSLNSGPTECGRDELLTGLKRITPQTAEVIDHFAAVRAGTRRRMPVIGQHSESRCLFVLNGLGSHGSLLAPVAAHAMKNLIEGTQIEAGFREVIDFVAAKPQRRSGRDVVDRPKSLTQMAHNTIRRIVNPGDTVVDATAGNGNDTCFLATLVGSAGCTIAIDIQQSAIDATAQRLKASALTADLRLADHALELARLKSNGQNARAVMFNLGYLPGSDRQVTTSGASTLSAIRSATEILLPGGAVTIVAYRGHSGGFEEAAKVEQSIGQLSGDLFETSRIEGDPGKPASPVLFIVRKLVRGRASAV